VARHDLETPPLSCSTARSGSAGVPSAIRMTEKGGLSPPQAAPWCTTAVRRGGRAPAGAPWCRFGWLVCTSSVQGHAAPCHRHRSGGVPYGTSFPSGNRMNAPGTRCPALEPAGCVLSRAERAWRAAPGAQVSHQAVRSLSIRGVLPGGLSKSQRLTHGHGKSLAFTPCPPSGTALA